MRHWAGTLYFFSHILCFDAVLSCQSRSGLFRPSHGENWQKGTQVPCCIWTQQLWIKKKSIVYLPITFAHSLPWILIRNLMKINLKDHKTWFGFSNRMILLLWLLIYCIWINICDTGPYLLSIISITFCFLQYHTSQCKLSIIALSSLQTYRVIIFN